MGKNPFGEVAGKQLEVGTHRRQTPAELVDLTTLETAPGGALTSNTIRSSPRESEHAGCASGKEIALPLTNPSGKSQANSSKSRHKEKETTKAKGRRAEASCSLIFNHATAFLALLWVLCGGRF